MKIETQRIRDLSEGIIQGIDEAIAPVNSVYLAVNFLFNKKIGRAVLRSGATQIGSQIVNDKSCLGLYQHNTTGGTKVPLAVFNDSGDANADVYAYSGGSWSKATEDLTQGEECDFVTFLDTTAILNGSDACRSTADGTSWVTTGGNLDIANMPQGKYGIEFKDRVYIAGVSGNLDRLYYSSIPSGGAVSWTSGNGYIDIEPEEGAGAITGLAKVPGYLLIFKERSMKRWDSNSTYPESMITIGCPSQKAIVQTKQSVFYFNKRGIYETIGGYPRKISRRIQDIIDAIPSSYYSSVSGWGDGEYVYFSIGDITLDDLSLNNCIVTYHINSETWSLFSLPNEIKYFGNYVDSNGDEFTMGGDDDGNVWKLFDGTVNDGSTAIDWLLQTHPLEFQTRGRVKDLSNYIVHTKNARNGYLSVRVNEEGKFENVGNFTHNIEEITKPVRGNYFEFRFQGQGTNTEIIGIDFDQPNINLSQKDNA